MKRLLDGYSREAETGHLLAWLRDQKKKNNDDDDDIYNFTDFD
jgi:hypothetical protein